MTGLGGYYKMDVMLCIERGGRIFLFKRIESKIHAKMVIGLLAITAIPTVTGVGNAISAQKKQNASLSKEQEKFHMTFIMEHEGKVQELGTGVVKDQKFYINFSDCPVDGYKFLGWYFKYPSEEGHLGLVSMVSDDPPALNWIYVDKDTHAVTYGGRKDTVGHVIGPWGWTEDDRFLTLEGDHDSFVAVREEGPEGEERWAVYWDPEGDIEDEVDDEDACRPVRLRRRPQFGMESRYVRDSEKAG